MKPVLEGLTEHDAPLARRLDHRVGLGERLCHRFLDEHVLAGRDRLEGDLAVKPHRGADVDDVDVVAGECLTEVNVPGAGTSQPALLGSLPGSLGNRIAEGAKGHPGDPPVVPHADPGRASAPDHQHPDLVAPQRPHGRLTPHALSN